METYSIMTGSEVSAPLSALAFAAKVRGREIKANTKVHVRSKAAWFDAKQLPLYNETIHRLKAEKASQKATCIFWIVTAGFILLIGGTAILGITGLFSNMGGSAALAGSTIALVIMELIAYAMFSVTFDR